MKSFSDRTDGVRAVVIESIQKKQPMYQMVRYHSCYIYKIFPVGNNVVTTVIVKYLKNLE